MHRFTRAALMSAALAFTTIGTFAMTDDAAAQSKPVTTPSGLQIDLVTQGVLAQPKQGQTAVVHYTGWLYTNGQKGTKFDSSVDRGQPFEFPVGAGRVIRGWDEGGCHRWQPPSRVGGTFMLATPSSQHEGRRQAHAGDPAGARLWRTRRRRRHPRQRDADLRC